MAAATIEIYGVGGSSHTVVPEQESVRKLELMKEDYVRLVFSTNEKINIRLGDYINTDWGTFYVTKPQKGAYNKSTGGYDYDIQFDAPHYRWNNKLYKFEPNSNRNEASWSLTDNLRNHMAVFLRNLTHHGWNYTVDQNSYLVEGVDKAVFIEFSNKYILDALTQIAEAFNVEWWITDNIIHLGKAEYGNAINFEEGVNVEEMTAEKTQGQYITRLYAFGAARNLPPDYRKNDEQVLLNGVVQKRVMMPASTPYVDIEQNLAADEIVEGIVFFDDVFPRTEATITEVTEIEKPVNESDSTTEATTDNVEQEGEQEMATFYRIKTGAYIFSKDYILAGQTLQMQFTSGRLNGMIFDVAFNPEGVSEKISAHGANDERVEVTNPEAQVFEIVRNDTYGLLLPNETLKPSYGDSFILLGWDITKVENGMGLVTAAENEVLARVRDYAARLKKDPLTYPCTMMSDYMYGLHNGHQDPNYSKVGSFELGQRIQLISDAYFAGGRRVSRVVGYEYKLDKPYDSPVIYVGESATYSSKKDSEAKLNDAVNSINYRNSEYGYSGVGGNVYVIGVNDNATPGDGNVYSALRSDRQYARKNRDDIISSLWTFKHGHGMRRGIQTEDYGSNNANEDNLFGKGFELISKTDSNGGVKTRLEIDELFVRIRAFFAKLEIREISYLGGNYVFSASGSRIYYVDWLDANGNVIDKAVGSIANVHRFRCYLYSDDGTTATINKWAVDDQVMCRTFNIDEGVHENVSNKFYWRRATGIGRGVIPSQVVQPEYAGETVPTPTQYQYVDISMSDCAIGSDYPEPEDVIVQFGNWTNSARQGVIYLQVEGEGSPAIMEYSGVGANGQHFVMPSPTLLLSPSKNVIYGEFHSVVDGQGGNTGDGDTIDDQLRALIDALNDIKNQADKKMEIWFGAYEPLPNKNNPSATANYPASEWITDDLKALHAQDLFYDTYKAPATQRGRAWRWIAAEGANNTIIYYWEDVTDQDTIDALEKIADVASDGKLTGGAEKVRVFLDWQKASEEYLKYTEQARDYGITTELTNYRAAFKALGKLLNGGTDLITSDSLSEIPTPSWLQNLQTETVIPSPTDYRAKWADYYTTLAALLKEIQRIAKALADHAQADADDALGKISDMADDGVLDPTEKITVKREFIALYHEMMDTDEAGYASGILDMAKDGSGQWLITYNDYILPYITAFRALGTYLNGGTSWTEPSLAQFTDSKLPLWIRNDEVNGQGEVTTAHMSAKNTITGSIWRQKWSDFYAKRTAVLTALTDHAQDTADSAHDRIDDVVSDGILSGGAEKSGVFIDWQRCIQEYLKYTEQADNYSVTKTSYVTAYTALATMLNGGTPASAAILNGSTRPAWLTTTNILLDTKLSDYSLTADQYRSKWNDYYIQLTLLIEAIGDKVKSLADDALEELDNMADDDILTEFEKMVCLREWEAAKAERASLVSQFANDPSTSTTTLSNCFNLLSHYLDNLSMTDYSEFTGTAPAILVTSGNTTINGSVFKQLWRNYYEARSSLLASGSTSKIQVFAQSSRPTPPYKVGDIWIQTNNGNNMMLCVYGRSAGATGADSDWADLSDITEKRDPRVLLSALCNMVYSYAGGYIRGKSSNSYLAVYLGSKPSSGHANGDISYYNGSVYQYPNSTAGWVSVSNDTLKTALDAMYGVIGSYTIRIYRTKPSSPNLYDLVCTPVNFTDSNAPSGYQTVEGGICIQMYNGTGWEVLQESTHSIIENIKGYIRAVAYQRASDYGTAAGFISSTDWAELFAEATDADGNKIAEAHMSAFVTHDSNGIIESGVKIRADKIDFQSGSLKISADNINFVGKTVINNKFTVDANGNVTMDGFKATNATITGSITATSGKIGGFKISGNGLTNENDNGTFTNDAYVILRNDSHRCFVGIGPNVLPSYSTARALARYEIEDNDDWFGGGANIALVLRAKNNTRNFAFMGEGNGVLNGWIGGCKFTKLTLSTANTIYSGSGYAELKTNNTFIVYSSVSNSGIGLPRLTEVRSALGISSSTNFAVVVTVISDLNSNSFVVRGRCRTQDSGGNKPWNTTELPLITHWDGSNWDEVPMGAGDSLTFLLVYDSSKSLTIDDYSCYYTARILNRQD